MDAIIAMAMQCSAPASSSAGAPPDPVLPVFRQTGLGWLSYLPIQLRLPFRRPLPIIFLPCRWAGKGFVFVFVLVCLVWLYLYSVSAIGHLYWWLDMLYCRRSVIFTSELLLCIYCGLYTATWHHQMNHSFLKQHMVACGIWQSSIVRLL